MIIETDTNDTYTTERIGAEPVSIETRALDLHIAEEAVEVAAAEYIEVRAGAVIYGGSVQRASEALDVALGDLKRAQRRYDQTERRLDR